MRKGIMAMEGLENILPEDPEATPPVGGDAPPADGAVPPADAPPADAPPADGAVPPADGATPPADATVPPVDGAVPPVDGAVPPADGDVPPADDAAVGEPPSVEDATAFLDAPEGDLLEAGDAGAQVDRVDADIDEAVSTVDTLEGISEAVEASLDEGGMSESAAGGLRVAVEQMLNRIGYPLTAKRYPAMENFSVVGPDRVKSTKIVLEGLKETIANIWAAIVNAFNNAVQWIKTFYKHLTDGAAGTRARAEKLAEAAKGFAGKSGSGTVNGAFVRQLFGGSGGAITPENFVASFGNYVKVANEISTKQTELVVKGGAGVSALMNGVLDNSAYEKAQENLKTLFGNAVVGKEAKGDDGSTVYEAPLGFGGKSWFSAVGGDAGKYYIADGSGKKEDTGELGEVAALTSAKDIEAIANAVAAHMGTYGDFHETLAAVEKAQKDVAAKSKALVQDQGEGFGERAKAAAKSAKAYISLATAAAKAFRTFDVTVSAAAVNYAGASLKAITTAAPAAAPAKLAAA